MSKYSQAIGNDESDLLSAEMAVMERWKQRFDPEIVANVIDPDSWKHEEELMRHGESEREGVTDGEQLGLFSAPTDFRDSLDQAEDEAAKAFLDADDMSRIGKIDLHELAEFSRAVALDFVAKAESCGCDHSNGQSCLICCVKLSAETICVIEGNGHDGYFTAEISDKIAQELEIVSRSQLYRLRKKFNEGSKAIAFGRN